jgi:rubredoxin
MSYTEEDFPVELECVECGAETTVTHDDVADFVPDHATALNATDVILIRRGWRERPEGHYCPDCAEDLPNPLED